MCSHIAHDQAGIVHQTQATDATPAEIVGLPLEALVSSPAASLVGPVKAPDLTKSTFDPVDNAEQGPCCGLDAAFPSLCSPVTEVATVPSGLPRPASPRRGFTPIGGITNRDRLGKEKPFSWVRYIYRCIVKPVVVVAVECSVAAVCLGLIKLLESRPSPVALRGGQLRL